MVKPIEVYTGPMFSGKSDELTTELRRETYVGFTPVLFKPLLDTRTEDEVCPRDGLPMPAITVKDSHAILDYLLVHYLGANPDQEIIVGIDEAQFFDADLPGIIYFIAHDLDIRVIVAGLSRDFRGVPFGPMPTILAMAQEIHTITAKCTYDNPETGKKCGLPATETYRSLDGEPSDFNDEVIKIGDKIIKNGDMTEGYEARCPDHHFVGNRPNSIDYPHSK